ncbi:MAG: endopeptidase La [Gemmatimonadota bacterium]|nr:endopeptidase La [Gemmatimonadota bacterium]
MATLIRIDQSYKIPDELPAIPLRDLVFFPYIVLPLLIGRPSSLAALEVAENGEGYVLLLAQKDVQVEEPTEKDTHHVGVVAKVLEVARLSDGNARVVFEGIGRARVQHFLPSKVGFKVAIEPFVAEERISLPESNEDEALARGVLRLFHEYVHLNDLVPADILGSISLESDRIKVAHLISGHLLVLPSEKQELLTAADVSAYFSLLREILVRELEILRIEEKLDAQIQMQADSDRRQFYLQEQLKAIHQELGSDSSTEWSDLAATIVSTPLPPHVQERAERELQHLEKLNPVAPEAAVIRTYLDWILGLPWTERGKDNLDVENAASILDEAHYGLDEVKERILDHVAVLSLVGELKGPIICLVGPPGVGKTSLGRSIAAALGREFVRVSLGGVRDEAEIRGHRRTYVGALPGRILQGMRRSGSVNPVFLLDEVDKLAHDFHGDPGAALLEVLDPEQNKTFTDHYLELEYDLSDVLFVATANTLTGIPEPLRDRMEIIRLPGYLDNEKVAIGIRFLWPHQARTHGLPIEVTLTEKAVAKVIRHYTREAGVRELDRRISRISRKIARRLADTTISTVEPLVIKPEDLRDLLGPPRYLDRSRDEGKRSGMANGLAWTEVGGEVLDVEVAVIPGTGQVQLTGTLGDVMKESAFAAVTYARSRASRLGIDPQFHKNVDIHIHIPEGATPKDGPSAGITMATALISALTGVPSRADVAMTGEITLRGRILRVGGIKEKLVAALREELSTVLLPAANVSDLELLPEEVVAGLRFVPVRNMDEVLAEALTPSPEIRKSLLEGRTSVGTQISQ